MEQKVLRVGTFVVACAMILRLAGGIMDASPAALSPKLVSFLIFMQTGRVIRPQNISFSPKPTESPEVTQPPPPTEPERPVFSPGEAENIGITSSFSYTADLPELLTKPLSWNLTGSEPKVLIVHSHGTESFAPTGEYAETTPYHTLDTDYNMISIGAFVAQKLQAAGISVLHDTALHDGVSYNAAYTNSRKSVQTYLQEHPSICLVLDLHRDSYEDEAGNQLVHTVFSQGTTVAPLMLVVGTNYGGLAHPQWQENLSLALKLQTLLEDSCPGICRNISLRTQRFNQDLSPGAMLVEVGASGNTRQEALRAAEVLAKGIISLAHGSK